MRLLGFGRGIFVVVARGGRRAIELVRVVWWTRFEVVCEACWRPAVEGRLLSD
jgi:hypothetical protein